jgi:precorrin-6B methylase 2
VEWTLLGVALFFFFALILPFVWLGVPPMPALFKERARVVQLLSTAEIPSGGRIYELGSGWGDLALALARAFPQAQIIAMEISPIPFFVSWLRALPLKNLEVQWGNCLKRDLRDADAVTAYLMIGPMPRLAAHLDRHLKEGTPVVALAFSFRDRASESESGVGGLTGKAWLYRWPART